MALRVPKAELSPETSDSSKVGAWDAADESLKSFAPMAVAA